MSEVTPLRVSGTSARAHRHNLENRTMPLTLNHEPLRAIPLDLSRRPTTARISDVLCRVPFDTPFCYQDLCFSTSESYHNVRRVVLDLHALGVLCSTRPVGHAKPGRRPLAFYFPQPTMDPSMTTEARLGRIEAKLDGLIEAMVKAFGAKTEA